MITFRCSQYYTHIYKVNIILYLAFYMLPSFYGFITTWVLVCIVNDWYDQINVSDIIQVLFCSGNGTPSNNLVSFDQVIYFVSIIVWKKEKFWKVSLFWFFISKVAHFKRKTCNFFCQSRHQDFSQILKNTFNVIFQSISVEISSEIVCFCF